MQSTNVDQLRIQCQSIANAHEFQLIRIECKWSIEHEHRSNVHPVDELLPPDHNINVLNDDCLQEIWNMPEIGLYELLQLSNICERFEVIARKSFCKKYAIDKELFVDMDLWQVHEILYIFGDLITSVDLSNNENGHIVLSLVEKYCENITSLICEYNGAATLPALRSLVPKLHQLTIQNFSDNLSILFDDRNVVYPLKKLHCIGFLNLTLPSMKLPQLTDVCLNGYSGTHRLLCSDFFPLNGQIEILEMRYPTFNLQITPHAIFKQLPNLKELSVIESVFMSIADFSCLTQLQHLKKLRLDVDFTTDESKTSFILESLRDANVHLESLSLKNVLFEWPNRLTYEICQMKTITSLKINYIDSITDDVLIQFVKQLDKLECIDIADISSMEKVYNVLKVPGHLKEAHFAIESEHDDASEILDEKSMAAIDAIIEANKINLRVHVPLSCEVSDLNSSICMVE